jgi:hypothetical protein
MKPDDNTKTSGRALKSTSEIFKLLPNLPAERIPCVFGNALLAHLRQHHAVAARVVRKPLQKFQLAALKILVGINIMSSVAGISTPRLSCKHGRGSGELSERKARPRVVPAHANG